jgi:hypothetical protein
MILTQDQIDKLEALRGTFHMGHTDDDVNSVAEDLMDTLGIDLIVVWDFEDMWGFGGDSDIFVAEGINLYEAPDGLFDFLHEKDSEVTIEHLVNAKRGKRAKKPPFRSDYHNWSWRCNPNKELD